MTNEKRTLDEIVSSILHYSFDEIDWNYDGLTPTEKEIITPEEFEELKKNFKGTKKDSNG
jgi:hypothetical protein